MTNPAPNGATPNGSFEDRVLVRFLRWRRILFTRELSLNRAGWTVIVGASLLAGTLIYMALQGIAQQRLLSAIEATDVIADLCAETPGLDPVGCRSINGKPRWMSDQLAWTLLIEAKLIEPADAETPAQLTTLLGARPDVAAVIGYLRSDPGPGTVDGEPAVVPGTANTVPLVIGLTGAMCAADSTADPAIGLKTDRIAHLEAGLYPARLPDAVGTLSGSGAHSFGNLLSGLLRMSRSNSVTNTEIISELTRLSKAELGPSVLGVGGKGVLGYGYEIANQKRCGLESMDEDAFFKRMQAFDALATYLLGRIGSNPDVRQRTMELTFITGPEQYGLMVFGAFALLLVVVRGMASMATARGARLARRIDEWTMSPAELQLRTYVRSWIFNKATNADPAVRGYWKDQLSDDFASGRWPVRFAIATLPAIGFIGTVRGILLSLSNADQIVWATTAAERAEAITSLSGNLGLAFATTTIALILGVIISFFSALEAWFEERTALTLFRVDFVAAASGADAEGADAAGVR